MRVITNADDFGECDDTVRATIECFERGALTSATIMANRPATADAIRWAREHGEHDFGAHLTWVGSAERQGPERPVCPADQVPDLVDAEGWLRPSNEVRRLALRGRIDVGQIARETEAQLGRLRDEGLTVSHVDSHGHLHKFAPFREALRRVLPRFGIRRVRRVQNVFLQRPLRSPTFWLGRLWQRGLDRDFETTPYFYMPGSGGDREWAQPLLSRLATLPAGRIEVGVHPGHDERWRDAERLEIQRFAEAARARGHELVGWAE